VPLKVVPRRDRKLYRVVKRGEMRKCLRGEVLYRAGDPAGHLYLVMTGHLRLIQEEDDGGGGSGRVGGRAVAIACPWELVGEEALLPDASRRTTAVAGESTELIALGGRATQGVLQTSRKTLEAFLRAKEEELALARTLGESRRSGGARRRLGALLLHLADRQGTRKGEGIQVAIPLTHQLLADLSHSHRSTVTTILNDWIYAGILVEGDVGIRILNPGVLRGGETPFR